MVSFPGPLHMQIVKCAITINRKVDKPYVRTALSKQAVYTSKYCQYNKLLPDYIFEFIEVSFPTYIIILASTKTFGNRANGLKR